MIIPPRKLPASILCYHGLTNGEAPPTDPAHVSGERFRSTIEFVRELAEIVPLWTLLERFRSGRDTRGLVAITFDDGYASVSDSADYLAREQIPITVFIVENAARTGEAFWWDRVGELHPRLSGARWRTVERLVGLPEAYRSGRLQRFGPLWPLRQWILSRYRGRCPPELNEALSKFEDELGVRTAHRPARCDELARLSACPHVDFGVHTRSHPVLPLLSRDEIRHEVAGCYDVIRERLPRVLPVLAIPFGLYDRATLDAAREAGMCASLSVANCALRGLSRGQAIPRILDNEKMPRWKLFLRLAGARNPLRRPDAFPALPSRRT